MSNSNRRSASKNSTGKKQPTPVNPEQEKHLEDAEKILQSALRFTFFIGKLKREVGESVPPSLLKLIRRIERPASAKRTKVYPEEFATMKAALDNPEFRADVTALYVNALDTGVKPDDWPAMCGYARAAFNQKYPDPDPDSDSGEEPLGDVSEGTSEVPREKAKTRSARSGRWWRTSEDSEEMPPEMPEPNLADLVDHPCGLYIARPKGWEEVYKLHIQVEEDKLTQKKLKEQTEKQQREINRTRKQKGKLESEKERLSGELKDLRLKPKLEAKKKRELEEKLRISERKCDESAENIAELQAELAEERKSTAAAKQQVHHEHVKWDEERSRKDALIRELEIRLQEQTSERRASATEALTLISESLHSAPTNKSLRESIGETLEEAARLLEVFLFPSDADDRSGLLEPETRFAASLPPGVLMNSLTAAEFLCLERKSFLIVDGYNFIFQRPGSDPQNLPKERTRLKKELEELYNRTGNSSLVIYDGKVTEFVSTKGRGGGVKEIFTVDGAKADSLVIRECEKAPRDRALVVVSADRGETAEDLGVRGPAEDLGANLLYPHQLMHVIEHLRK